MNDEDKAWSDYSEHFREDVIPKLLNSAVYLAIGTEAGEFDVKFATETGAAILLDKPMLIVVPKGRTIGIRLRRAADIVLDDFDLKDATSQSRMLEAINLLKPDS